jgi:hypothetical protein
MSKTLERVQKIEAALGEPRSGSTSGDRRLALLQTVLVEQAIDRLTAAVKSLDNTIDNASLPDLHPHKR